MVQGGPGTGKTAVALHRAAFLLYTHREQLARRVVLVIGPVPRSSLRRQVLPSLGETLGAAVHDRRPVPGHHRAACGVHRAGLKGRLKMAEVIATAVRDRQGPATGGLEVTFEGIPCASTAPSSRIRDRARRARCRTPDRPLWPTGC